MQLGELKPKTKRGAAQSYPDYQTVTTARQTPKVVKKKTKAKTPRPQSPKNQPEWQMLQKHTVPRKLIKYVPTVAPPKAKKTKIK